MDNTPFRLLYVCTGNICRSPLAERLTTARIGPLEADVLRVTSVGTGAANGLPMDLHAAAELVRLGGDPQGFLSRQIHPRDMEGVDLVLCATRQHRSQVLSEVPSALRRVFTIREFAALLPMSSSSHPGAMVREVAAARACAEIEDYDVADPYGRGVEEHAVAAEQISACVDVIAAALRRCLA